ncbi:MAG: putative glycogen debranching enzyme [Chlamydiales bacterium]|jgi:predicted glycogen debranching enzyme
MPSAPQKTHSLIHWSRADSQGSNAPLSSEWLETNGLGDFAASTIPCCATRRYHGLLVARPPGNVKRHVFLARLEEHLVDEGAQSRWPLSTAAYPDVLAPRGQDTLQEFELLPYPSALYRQDGASIRREILLVAGQPTVLVRYQITGAAAGSELELEPMFACREADALTVENDVLTSEFVKQGPGFAFEPYAALPAVQVTLSAAGHTFEARPTWYKNLQYAADAERGYEHSEDQFAPGLLHIPVDCNGEKPFEVVLAATIAAPVADPAALWKSESARRRKTLTRLDTDDLGSGQVLAAEAFLYRTPTGRTGVNAGYPWFVEWGRDTFIALPGLTLGTEQPERCLQGLSGALEFLQDGLLPNVYGSNRADSHYNSADAALWFARATRLYECATGDTAGTAETFLPALTEIAESYRDGTELGIAMDASGLLSAGSTELNATWMDAQVDGQPVTPRDGYPVEINALWYSLISHVELLLNSSQSRKAAAPWRQLRLLARRSFLERFWLPDAGMLADRWIADPASGGRDGKPDRSVRPNMVIAAAMELSPLSRAQRRAIVKLARAQLLTPFGLRTLAPDDARYQGTFAGSPAERDRAYHQGTAWPWLLGFFAEADLRAQGVNKKSLASTMRLWSELEQHQASTGLNHLSEVFSGNAPHAPGGCFAQAWNTGEYLRIRAAVRKSSI